MTTSSNIAQTSRNHQLVERTFIMTNDYNITDEEINEVTTKMENQFVELGKFLDDRTPEENLKPLTNKLSNFNKKNIILKKKSP